MPNSARHSKSVWVAFGAKTHSAWLLVCALALLGTAAEAQTLTVLHTFTGGAEGANPIAGLAMDRAGNLYGTTAFGGNAGSGCNRAGCGTVFKLSHHGSGWIFAPLYRFQNAADGYTPEANVVFGPDGGLYGTTFYGGADNLGTVFKLQPAATFCASVSCPWIKTLVYQFTGIPNGGWPLGTLLFDSSGNIDGVTEIGGTGDLGTVYKLTPSSGGWMRTVLDGALSSPSSGVVADTTGNLYGTTSVAGAHFDGSVYQLVNSGSGWTFNVLVSFDGENGSEPMGGVILDAAGNVYGGTSGGGTGGGGTIFELSPSGGNWALTNLYDFGLESLGVVASLTMDAAGNLYGATEDGGAYLLGNVFKLTRSNQGWSYTDLHDFTGGSDGALPGGSVILDASGNIYGTAYGGASQQCSGAQNGCGTVWEITP